MHLTKVTRSITTGSTTKRRQEMTMGCFSIPVHRQTHRTLISEYKSSNGVSGAMRRGTMILSRSPQAFRNSNEFHCKRRVCSQAAILLFPLSRTLSAGFTFMALSCFVLRSKRLRIQRKCGLTWRYQHCGEHGMQMTTTRLFFIGHTERF